MSEVRKQPDNNYLDYMIDMTFKNIKRLFAYSFKLLRSLTARNSF